MSNIVYNIVAKEYFDGIWEYLWYVEAMMLIFIAYVILRHFIKSERVLG